MTSKGTSFARILIDKYAISEPNEIPIEDIIMNEGPYIIEKSMTGAEGRILLDKTHALITVNSKITDHCKKRFILAHELGHFEMHRDLQPFYNDTENELWEWKSNKKEENEANEFAAELLMPSEIFTKLTKTEKFSLHLILKLKDLFETSIVATAIRFAEKGYDPILLVCSQKNKIKWFVKNEAFPFAKIIVRQDVPINTVTHEYFCKDIRYSAPEEIEPKYWNITDRYNGELKFYEQCLYFDYYNYVLSFIWID